MPTDQALSAKTRAAADDLGRRRDLGLRYFLAALRHDEGAGPSEDRSEIRHSRLKGVTEMTSLAELPA